MGKMRELIFCQECGTKLADVTDGGRRRKKCEKCNRIAYESPVPATAAVVFNPGGEVLLVKRNAEPKIGQWCLPGGFIEVGETPEECCLRELEEETGLKGTAAKIIASVPGVNPFYKSVIVTGYGIRSYSGELKAGDDSDESRFFNSKDMPPIAFKSHREVLEIYSRNERYDIDHAKLHRMGAYVITSGEHVMLARKACLAGARIIQYRDKSSSQSDKLKTALSIREITRKTGALFIVNDHIDIALMSESDGVHLGQDDVRIPEARKIVPENFIIGKSTHSLKQALQGEAEGADYIGIGPVYSTPTKESYVPIGVNVVRQVAESVRIPFVCIGGLNLDNIGQLIGLGAKNLAMVREFAEGTEEKVKAVNQLFEG